MKILTSKDPRDDAPLCERARIDINSIVRDVMPNAQTSTKGRLPRSMERPYPGGGPAPYNKHVAIP